MVPTTIASILQHHQLLNDRIVELTFQLASELSIGNKDRISMILDDLTHTYKELREFGKIVVFTKDKIV